MTTRIAISTTKFNVSRPGYDANTATVDQLAFEAFGDNYSGIFLSGETAYDGTWTGAVISPGSTFGAYSPYRYKKEIMFGRTLSVPPLCVYSVRPIGGTTIAARPRYTYSYWSGSSSQSTVMGACTLTDRLILSIDTYRNPAIPTWFGPPNGLNYTFSYAVFFL